VVLPASGRETPASASSPASTGRTGSALHVQQDAVAAAFPGFEPGQEIRYTLEGEGGLVRALRSVWSIRLEDVEEPGVGVFELTHGFGGFSSGYGQGPTAGPSTTARAWIDPRGFPLRVRIFEGWAGPGSDTAGHVIEYRYDDGEYIKELQAEDVTEDQGVDLPDRPGLDPDGRRGLYLFMPLGPDCLVEVASTRLAGVQGGGAGAGSTGGAGAGAGGRGGGSAAGGEDRPDPCRGRQIVFANPGLLNLTMPALWEAGTGEHEFTFLAPTGLDRAALARLGNNRGGTNFSFGGVNVGDLLFGPDILGAAENAFGTFRLESRGDLAEVDLGEWTESAWRFVSPDPVDAVWVDGQGSVVKLDMVSAAGDEPGLSIRRLRPSEY